MQIFTINEQLVSNRSYISDSISAVSVINGQTLGYKSVLLAPPCHYLVSEHGSSSFSIVKSLFLPCLSLHPSPPFGKLTSRTNHMPVATKLQFVRLQRLCTYIVTSTSWPLFYSSLRYFTMSGKSHSTKYNASTGS